MRQLWIFFVVVSILLLGIFFAPVIVSFRPVFVVLGILGLILAAIAVAHPIAGLMILLLAMLLSPEVAIGRAGDRPTTIGGADVLIVLIVLGWIVHQGIMRRGIFLKGTPINLPIFAMIAVIVLSTLIGILAGTVTPVRGFFFASKRIEYFVIFFMVTALLRGWEDVKVALVLFLVACAAINVTAIVQEVFFPIAGGVTSTFGYGRANTLGGFYVMAIAVTLGLATYVERPRLRALLIVQFVLSVICLAFTHSRGAYVSLPFALAMVIGVDRSKRLLRITGFAFLVAVALVLGAWLVLGGERSPFLRRQKRTMSGQIESIGAVLTEGAEADPSMNSRVRSWRKSIPEVQRYPLLGQGVGAKKLGWSDNHYVRELLETGMLGLFIFLWMNVWIFLTVLTLHRDADGIVRGVAVGFLGAQAGLLVHAVTCSNFYTIRTMEPFWFLLGLLMVMRITVVGEPDADGSPRENDAPAIAKA